MDIVAGKSLEDLILISFEAVCIPYNANTLGKGVNPTILLPAIGKILPFKLCMGIGLREEKVIKLPLKFYVVLNLVCVEGLGKFLLIHYYEAIGCDQNCKIRVSPPQRKKRRSNNKERKNS